MGFLKKNFIFTLAVVICLLLFAAGAYLAIAESNTISMAKQKIRSAESELNRFLSANPAPTEENVIASKQNLAELSNELLKIREVLQRGARISTSTDGIGVSAAIQQYIAGHQRKASRYAYQDAKGEQKTIQLPDNFGFGFEQYQGVSPTLDDSETTGLLDKQRQILSYLLDKLYDAKPHQLVAVKREIIEDQSKDKNQKSFKVGKAITAKIPGAVDTMGFSLSFTGYTDSLRAFLNQLRKFDLPIVVRSIEVKRSSGLTTNSGPDDESFDSVFGGFGGAPVSSSAANVDEKPVISENVSTFTVVLEFIQVILPEEKNA